MNRLDLLLNNDCLVGGIAAGLFMHECAALHLLRPASTLGALGIAPGSGAPARVSEPSALVKHVTINKQAIRDHALAYKIITELGEASGVHWTIWDTVVQQNTMIKIWQQTDTLLWTYEIMESYDALKGYPDSQPQLFRVRNRLALLSRLLRCETNNKGAALALVPYKMALLDAIYIAVTKPRRRWTRFVVRLLCSTAAEEDVPRLAALLQRPGYEPLLAQLPQRLPVEAHDWSIDTFNCPFCEACRMFS